MSFYVISDYGKSLRSVIKAGPFETESEARAYIGISYTMHVLELSIEAEERILRALEEEKQLIETLRTGLSTKARGVKRV